MDESRQAQLLRQAVLRDFLEKKAKGLGCTEELAAHVYRLELRIEQLEHTIARLAADDDLEY